MIHITHRVVYNKTNLYSIIFTITIHYTVYSILYNTCLWGDGGDTLYSHKGSMAVDRSSRT